MDLLPAYSFKVKCTIIPSKTSMHTFSFMTIDPGKLFVNNELFINNWDWTEEGEAMFDGSEDVLRLVYLQGDQIYDILVESNNEIRPKSKQSFEGPGHHYGGCRPGYEEATVHLFQQAADIAKEADVAVVVVGPDAEWESEGCDCQTMGLPRDGNRDAFIEAVA